MTAYNPVQHASHVVHTLLSAEQVASWVGVYVGLDVGEPRRKRSRAAAISHTRMCLPLHQGDGFGGRGYRTDPKFLTDPLLLCFMLSEKSCTGWHRVFDYQHVHPSVGAPPLEVGWPLCSAPWAEAWLAPPLEL